MERSVSGGIVEWGKERRTWKVHSEGSEVGDGMSWAVGSRLLAFIIVYE